MAAPSGKNFSVTDAVKEFASILARLDVSFRKEFCCTVNQIISDTDDSCKEDTILRTIAEKLRHHPNVPVTAVVKTESITHPTVGEFSALQPSTVVNIDNFLYEDDDAIDQLCEEGTISRNYCLECGSHRTAPLNFISHSASLQQLKFIFQQALPDMREKTVVDVGSRLGVILYGAYYYSAASRIIGIEINQELCDIQNDIIEEFLLKDKIEIVCADVCTQRSLLEKADVVILHNVFEFFASTDQQVKIWTFLKEVLHHKGTLLVTVPSLPETLQDLETNIDVDEWVRKLSVDFTGFSLPNEEDQEQLDNVCLYEVIG